MTDSSTIRLAEPVHEDHGDVHQERRIRREPAVVTIHPNEQKCEKCGSDDVYMRYQKYAARWSWEYRNGYIYEREGMRMDDDPRLEHLSCTCRRCGYRWGIPTLDDHSPEWDAS